MWKREQDTLGVDPCLMLIQYRERRSIFLFISKKDVRGSLGLKKSVFFSLRNTDSFEMNFKWGLETDWKYWIWIIIYSLSASNSFSPHRVNKGREDVFRTLRFHVHINDDRGCPSVLSGFCSSFWLTWHRALLSIFDHISGSISGVFLPQDCISSCLGEWSQWFLRSWQSKLNTSIMAYSIMIMRRFHPLWFATG